MICETVRQLPQDKFLNSTSGAERCEFEASPQVVVRFYCSCCGDGWHSCELPLSAVPANVTAEKEIRRRVWCWLRKHPRKGAATSFVAA